MYCSGMMLKDVFSSPHRLVTVHFTHRLGHGAFIHHVNQENPLKPLLTAEACINNQMWDGLTINKTVLIVSFAAMLMGRLDPHDEE